MSADLNKEIKRLSNLANYKNKSKQEIEKDAAVNLVVREFKNSPAFKCDVDADAETKKKIEDRLKEEQSSMLDRFKGYLNDFKIESSSDIDTLKSLVFVEMLEIRIQKLINEFSVAGTFPSDKVTQQLINLQNQKSSLKIKLGIDSTDEKKDDLTILEQAEERFQKHYEENMNEFDLTVPLICPKCNHEHIFHHLMRKRVKDFDTIKHPFFLGKWFVNVPVIRFVKEGILTKEQAAEILCNASDNEQSLQAFTVEYCSDMIDFCLEKWGEIFSVNKVN